MIRGTAIATIQCSPTAVFAAITDVGRMGEWSPECTGGRWISPATGPSVGAQFEGDNIAKLGPLTVKKWTTVSEVTQCVPDQLFEFMAEDFTRWRYELVEIDGATRVTETFRHPPYEGLRHVVRTTLLKRTEGLVAAMEHTLAQLKATLEPSNASSEK